MAFCKSGTLHVNLKPPNVQYRVVRNSFHSLKQFENKDQAVRINGLNFFYFQSMGSSLTFRGTVDEASELMKNHRCSNAICDTNLWRVKHELDSPQICIANWIAT